MKYQGLFSLKNNLKYLECHLQFCLALSGLMEYWVKPREIHMAWVKPKKDYKDIIIKQYYWNVVY